MNYQDYKDARDASWRILIDCEVTELPVRISGVCRALGVSVRRYTPAERDSNDGMSTVIGGAPTIMVSSLAIPARQLFTCFTAPIYPAVRMPDGSSTMAMPTNDYNMLTIFPASVTG